MRSDTRKTNWPVFDRLQDFTAYREPDVECMAGPARSSFVTIAGPRGANVSKLFLRDH